METKILKGETAKSRILAETRTAITDLKTRFGKTPGIAFIGFEGVPLSKYTIPLHVHLAEELGFNVHLEILPENVTEEELFARTRRLNTDEDIHAVVVLQPVPKHLNGLRISNSIIPEKEVEGFHPMNILGTLLPEVIANKYPMCLTSALAEIFMEAGIKPGKDQE